MNKKVITIFRKTHKLTQQDLGELLSIGNKTVSHYETGRLPIPKHIKTKLEELIQANGIDRTEQVESGYRVGKKRKLAITQPEPVQNEKKLTEEQVGSSLHMYNETSRPIEELPAVLDEMFGRNKPEEIQEIFEVRPDSEHYHTGTVDVWKFAEENFTDEEILGFHRINAIKYITRYGKKGGKNPKDLEKAITSVQKILQLEGAKI